MTTTVKIDLNDQGATKTLGDLAAKFGSTGKAADSLGGSIGNVEGHLGRIGGAAKRAGADIGGAAGKTDGLMASFKQIALGGAAWQGITFAVGKFNESMKAAAAEGVEPMEISLDRLITRVVEGSNALSIFGGLTDTVFAINDKEKQLDKAVDARKEKIKAVEKEIADNATRYTELGIANEMRAFVLSEQNAAKKLKSSFEIQAAEQKILDTALELVKTESFSATEKAKAEAAIQILAARRLELEAEQKAEVDKRNEALKLEHQRIKETIEAAKEAGVYTKFYMDRLMAQERELAQRRTDQDALQREREEDRHRERIKQINERGALEKQRLDELEQQRAAAAQKEIERQQKINEALAARLRGGAAGGQQQGQGPGLAQQVIDRVRPADVAREAFMQRQRVIRANAQARIQQQIEQVGARINDGDFVPGVDGEDDGAARRRIAAIRRNELARQRREENRARAQLFRAARQRLDPNAGPAGPPPGEQIQAGLDAGIAKAVGAAGKVIAGRAKLDAQAAKVLEDTVKQMIDAANQDVQFDRRLKAVEMALRQPDRARAQVRNR